MNLVRARSPLTFRIRQVQITVDKTIDYGTGESPEPVSNDRKHERDHISGV